MCFKAKLPLRLLMMRGYILISMKILLRMEDIAIEFGDRFDGKLVPMFNSNTQYGTPIFLINIEDGKPTPYCTTVEHFFGNNDYMDLCYFFKELDKDNEMFFVVHDGHDTEVFTMKRTRK